MGSSIVYHDVTQLVHWGGKITGIPRVMNELAVRAQRDDNTAVFVSWVKEVGALCEIDLSASLERRGEKIIYRQVDSGPSIRAAGNSTVPPRTPSRRVVKGLKKAAKAAIARTELIHPGLRRRIEQRVYSAVASRYKQAAPQKGDTIFITWGEWWDGVYLAMLERLHDEGVHLSTVIHDVGPMVAPHLSGHSTASLSAYCQRIVPLCDMVFCVSRNTQADLTVWLQQHGYSIPPMTVIRLGEDFSSDPPQRPHHENFAASGLKGDDYIMCMGTVELKKNHTLLYYTYRLAYERGITLPKIIVAGRKGWMSEVFLELISKDPQIKNQFVFVEQPSDAELVWLYEHCRFTLLPSYYEGWGIPIAESLYYGVPCASSNTSSMVEIGEGIIEHFSPSSSDECLQAIQRWLDPAALADARKKTNAYQPTSWDQTYVQVAKELEKLT